MPDTISLSDTALSLFRLHVERQGRIDVDHSNREPYRELERAGLVLLSRPFTGPRTYVLTKIGWKMIEVLARIETNAPSPEESHAPRL